MTTPRWFTEHPSGHSAGYVERFRRLAADGSDLDGEARFVDALLPRGARVLDAGCGPGRVGAALHARGHQVVGVDVDAELIAAAQADHPGPTWLVGDLSDLGRLGDLGNGGDLGSLRDLGSLSEVGNGDTPGSGGLRGFDAAVLAGNVMVFLAPGSERGVLGQLAAAVRPDGVLVAGFATDRAYRVEDLDRDAGSVGLLLEHRFATWDLRAWHPGADWAVSVLRRPAR